MWYDFTNSMTEEHVYGDTRSESNYIEQAKFWKDEESFFERKLTLAPFYASGVSILAISAFIVGENVKVEVVALLLPSAWLFVLSLISMFLAGCFYIAFSTYREAEYRERGNAQSEFHNLRDKLRGPNKTTVVSEIENLEKYVPAILLSVNRKIDSANKSKLIAFKKLFFARFFAIFGTGFLLLGILTPLLVLSLSSSYKFLWS